MASTIVIAFNTVVLRGVALEPGDPGADEWTLALRLWRRR